MKYPGLTVVGGLAMAFAIWVGIVVFQVVSVLTNPTVPVSQGARLVEIRSIDVAASVHEKRILHDFLDWQHSLRSLTDVGAWRDSSRNLVVAAGDARPVNVAEMSVSGFRVADGETLMGRMLVEADVPGAGRVTLLSIPRWDFGWQDSYFFTTPLTLPKGTRVDAEIVYDNSELNIRNPNAPPKRVKWGLGTFDEMGSVTLMLATSNRQDERMLRQNESQHFRQQLLDMFSRAR
jgi:hypothetical protein